MTNCSGPFEEVLYFNRNTEKWDNERTLKLLPEYACKPSLINGFADYLPHTQLAQYAKDCLRICVKVTIWAAQI